MSLLEIRVLGDPILRETTTPVAEVTDELRRLVDSMFETMYTAKGIGLAAPQVGRSERLAVLDVDDQPLVIINPEIVLRDGPLAKAEEGCLSIPEVFGDVQRPSVVSVRALDHNGQPFEVEGRELLGRCLQHEIDHLHGRLFLDHLSVLRRRAALAKWGREVQRYPSLRRALDPRDVAKHHNDEAL